MYLFLGAGVRPKLDHYVIGFCPRRLETSESTLPPVYALASGKHAWSWVLYPTLRWLDSIVKIGRTFTPRGGVAIATEFRTGTRP